MKMKRKDRNERKINKRSKKKWQLKRYFQKIIKENEWIWGLEKLNEIYMDLSKRGRIKKWIRS